MSKRLRASLASKRGRMLRPRSDRASSAGVATDGTESQETENLEDDRGSLAPVDDRASEIPEAALDVSTLNVTTPIVTPAPAAVEAIAAAEEVVPAPSPELVAATESVATAAEEVVPAPVETAEVKSEPSVLASAAPVAAVEPEPVVVPQPVAEAPVEAPVEALATEPSAPVQVAVAAAEGDAKKKKKKKSDKGKRVETAQSAPKPAEPTKADEPRAESVAASSAPAVAAGVAKDDAPREASSTPMAFAGEDDHDLSISNHHFFSSPEIVDHAAVIEDDHPKYIPPTKEAMERQTRLKRIVGGVVAVAALVAVIGVGKMVLGSKPADAMPSSTPAAKPVKADEPKTTEPTVTATQAAAPLATPAPSTDTSAAPAESSSAAPSASASADAPPAGELKSPEEIKKLEIRCAQLGNGTDMKKAVETCREALAAGGTNAMTYMYIYNSLLTLGKGGEAREALNDCVTNATTGNKGECAQWGGKKK